MFFVHLSFTGQGKDTYKIKTIVIDAGHGGHDAGCLGASSREKHVALDIALKLGKIFFHWLQKIILSIIASDLG